MAQQYFFPPTDAQSGPITDFWGNIPEDADPLMVRLFSHYRPLNRGRLVFLMNDNSITETQPPNWDGSTFTSPVSSQPNVAAQQPYAYSYTYAGGVNPPSGVTTFTLDPPQQVKRVFWGGVNNPVTAAEATLLTAAGYTVNSGVY